MALFNTPGVADHAPVSPPMFDAAAPVVAAAAGLSVAQIIALQRRQDYPLILM